MRKENWPDILAEYIKKAEVSDFVWGENDCCLFAADFVYEITGIDYASKFRGKYKTAKGALSALKKYGNGTITETVSEMLEQKPVAFAQRGDVVSMNTEHGDALGICAGVYSVFVSYDGVSKVKTNDCHTAWSVN